MKCLLPPSPLRFMYGEAEYETYSASAYKSKQAVATCYFILYLGTVLLLLVNLLVALLVHTYGSAREMAGKTWKLRWALYVIRAEARLPHVWQQRYRVGQVAYDPALQQRVYNHVFESEWEERGAGRVGGRVLRRVTLAGGYPSLGLLAHINTHNTHTWVLNLVFGMLVPVRLAASADADQHQFMFVPWLLVLTVVLWVENKWRAPQRPRTGWAPHCPPPCPLPPAS